MKMIFIRHAEPDKDERLSERGRVAILASLELGRFPKYDRSFVYFTSYLPRSIETMQIIYPEANWIPFRLLNEWNKTTESLEEFKSRVSRMVEEIKKEKNVIIIGHSRWMTWAHWLLKGEPALGFDYLEGFEA